MRAARSSATAGRRSLQATRAPAEAKPEAATPPMLGLAPVTSTTFPARRPAVTLSLMRRGLPPFSPAAHLFGHSNVAAARRT